MWMTFGRPLSRAGFGLLQFESTGLPLSGVGHLGTLPRDLLSRLLCGLTARALRLVCALDEAQYLLGTTRHEPFGRSSVLEGCR